MVYSEPGNMYTGRGKGRCAATGSNATNKVMWE